VILLRNVAHSLYLILTVLLSYFTTLGLTFAVFRIWEGEAFQGLNWTVPMFLFTVLVAVGADYNIFLVTRIEEEQQRHGPVRGIQVALVRTGRIISSCGVIMAGTFASLVIGGTLTGMVQLGTALCCGVLLDTFVVRPVLVPAYLLLLQSGRFGRWGKYLGSLGPAASGPGGSASPPAAPGQPPAGSAIPHSIRR
jgi:RND superfamily putative drug exporter